MNRKTVYLAGIMAAAFAFTSCGESIKTKPGKGEVTKRYAVNAFKRIECNAAIDLIFSQGSETSVKASGNSHIISHLIVSTQDSTLRISLEKDFRLQGFEGNNHATFTVSSPELCSIRQRGAGNITLKDSVLTDCLEIGSFGAGNFKAEALKANRLKVHSKGVGNLVLKGEAHSAGYYIEGIGNVNAKGLIASDVVAEQEGIGNVSCHASKTLTARTHGIGNIDCYGKPEVRKLTKKGIGSINMR